MTQKRISVTELNPDTPVVHPKKSTKIANYVAIASLLLTALAVGIFLKWSFADTDILQIKNNPFPARIVNDPTKSTGGIVFLDADYCKTSDIVGEIRVSYVSKSREIFLPLTKEQLPKGCDKKEVPVVIPLSILQDTYRIKFRVTYDINPLKQNIVTNFESQEFKVGTPLPE